MPCRSCRGSREEEKWGRGKGYLDNSVEKKRRERKREMGDGVEEGGEEKGFIFCH